MNKVNTIRKQVQSFLDKTPILLHHITRNFMDSLTSEELSKMVDIFYKAYKTAEPEALSEIRLWFFSTFDTELRWVLPFDNQTRISREVYAKYDIFRVLFWQKDIINSRYDPDKLIYNNYTEDMLFKAIKQLDLSDVWKLYGRTIVYMQHGMHNSVPLYKALVYNILEREVGYAKHSNEDSKNQ